MNYLDSLAINFDALVGSVTTLKRLHADNEAAVSRLESAHKAMKRAADLVREHRSGARQG